MIFLSTYPLSGELIMRDQDQNESSLDIDIYARSQGQLRELNSQLPLEAVETLSRETLRRLAERDRDVSIYAPSDEKVERLCHALLDDDHLAGAAFINALRSAGASIDVVYLKYLASAARKLGDWWDNDMVSFTKVALGTSRMYAIMRAMRHQMPLNPGLSSKSAIFVSVPGETHTLGVSMATDLFRKEGWDIDLHIGEDHDSLVAHIVQSEMPLVGISAGGPYSLHALSRLVVALRIKTPGTALFVSGQITEDDMKAVNLIGVDGVATDIDTAKALMNNLWDRLQG